MPEISPFLTHVPGTPGADEFVRDLRSKARRHGVELSLQDQAWVPFGNGMRVNGYFDPDPPVLACACGKDPALWFPVLLHESSHMDQWVERTPEWMGYPGLEQTDSWLSGEDVDPHVVRSEVAGAIRLELDCERRTLAKVREFRLEPVVDPVEYARKANAYLLFYLWMLRSRRWYSIGREPYNIPEVVSAMPDSLDIDHTRLDPAIAAIFDKNL